MRPLTYLFLIMAVAAGLYLLDSADSVNTAPEQVQVLPATSSVPVIANSAENMAFDISVHNADELRKVLERAEMLVSSPKSASQPANIALMLHGPEIEYFSINKYAQYKDIVDLAARLDAYNVVELKMCETAMKDFGIKKDDIPGFIEFVPNGDVELKQLSQRGFSIM